MEKDDQKCYACGSTLEEISVFEIENQAFDPTVVYPTALYCKTCNTVEHFNGDIGAIENKN